MATTEGYHDDERPRRGFRLPTTTPVPDEVFDDLLDRLTGAELKALLYIIRRTFGFKKDADSISFSQFLKGITTRDGRVLDRGCGVRDRTTLSKSLKKLEDMGLVVATKVKDERGEYDTSIYALCFEPGSPRGVVGKPDDPRREIPPRVVGKPDLQQTAQQTERQEKYTRPRKMASDGPHDYSRGPYGLCPICLQRPCDPDCPTERQQEA